MYISLINFLGFVLLREVAYVSGGILNPAIAFSQFIVQKLIGESDD